MAGYRWALLSFLLAVGCRLEALVAQLDAPVPLSASRNDDSATCP